MWSRKLIKNKIYAILIVLIGALSVPIEWDATFFLFTLMFGILLFVSRENCIMNSGGGYMSRAERRRAQKCEQKAKTATYNLTRAQLDALVREKISGELDRVKQEATNDAINQAMILLLTLPLEVLMDHYWPKSYAKRIPEFTEHVLEYYEKWQNDELDMDKLKEDLWVYGGVRLEEVEGK